MSSIPEEIGFEIFLRLPVKSILLCKFACKTWFSIISDPVFVKVHLYNAQRNVVVKSLDESKAKHVMHSVGYEALCSSSSEIEGEHNVMDVPYPTSYLLCCCDGLVCLRCYDETTGFFCLSNPATTEHKKIPKSPHRDEDKDILAHALYFDRQTDDYQLILVLHFITSYSVDVYTLRSNSWKSRQIFLPYRFWFGQKPGVLVNGALHWSGKNGYSWLIICLDTIEENFKELQLPKELVENKHLTVGAVEGCLCVLSSDVMADFEVWVMPDYGIQESWTKSHIINHEKISTLNNLKLIGNNLSLVWSSKGGGVLLLCNWSQLIIYDTKDSSARVAMKRGSLMYYKAENYVESLVSLNSGTCMGTKIMN